MVSESTGESSPVDVINAGNMLTSIQDKVKSDESKVGILQKLQ